MTAGSGRSRCLHRQRGGGVVESIPSPARSTRRTCPAWTAACTRTVVLLLACTGCAAAAPGGPGRGAPAPSRSSSAQASPTATALRVEGVVLGHDLGPLGTAVSYPALGMALAPPAPGQVPAVTAAQAVARCHIDTPCPTSAGPARVVLARVTSQDPATIDPVGTTAPLVVDRLAYVLRWDDVECWPTGAPGQGEPTPSRCTDVELVDATSGTFIFGTSTNATVP